MEAIIERKTVSEVIGSAFADENIDVRTGRTVTALVTDGDEVTAEVDGPDGTEHVTSSDVLIATGRHRTPTKSASRRQVLRPTTPDSSRPPTGSKRPPTASTRSETPTGQRETPAGRRCSRTRPGTTRTDCIAISHKTRGSARPGASCRGRSSLLHNR